MSTQTARGSVTVVKGATTLLSEGGAAMPEPIRAEVAEMLSRSVTSLHDMLNDLLSLARLEAGQERREITTAQRSCAPMRGIWGGGRRLTCAVSACLVRHPRSQIPR